MCTAVQRCRAVVIRQHNAYVGRLAARYDKVNVGALLIAADSHRNRYCRAVVKVTAYTRVAGQNYILFGTGILNLFDFTKLQACLLQHTLSFVNRFADNIRYRLIAFVNYQVDASSLRSLVQALRRLAENSADFAAVHMLVRHLADIKACGLQLLLRLRERHACNIRHSLQLRALTDGQDNKAALLTFFAGLWGLLHNSTRLKLIRIAVFFL